MAKTPSSRLSSQPRSQKKTRATKTKTKETSSAAASTKPAHSTKTSAAKKKSAPPSKTSSKSAQRLEPSAVQPEIVEHEELLEREGLPQPEAIFDDEAEGPIDIDIDIDPDSEVELDESVPRSVAAEIVEPKKSESRALAPTDPVAMYLAEIRRYPLLTKEQERELAIRYRETGDPKAAEMLVTSNLRFVVKIAAEYSRFGAKLIDLIQEGNVGLMHAVKEFNPYKGVRLITYAVWWIRGYIQEYLMRQYSMVRIGTTQNQRKLFYRLQKERELLGQMGMEPNYALLAGRLGVSEEEVETMTKRMSGRDVSLNQPLDSGSPSAATLLDFEPTADEAIDEQLGHHEELEVLKRNIEQIRSELSEKELFILEKRILADEPLTLQEIGEHYGVTREAVRQLEARLIGKIRDSVTRSLGED